MNTIPLLLNTSDGLTLRGNIWETEGQPKAALCLIHGHGEHIGRYLHVAQAFTQAGYALLGMDLRGHGKSDGPRGHIPAYSSLMDDLHLLLENASKRYSEAPLVLYGHSLGGNLVLNYALRQEHDLQAVIATGPWLRLAFEPPLIKITLGHLMNRLYPAFSQPSGVDTTALSHDPAVVTAYKADPLVHDRISARLFMDIHTAGLWALDHAGSLPTPTLLMHGTEDRLTSAQASEEFARRAGKICTLRLWEGLFHEIHNEPEKEDVLAEILSWLNDHL